MKAMIWKEWRENLRWALLAAVGLGIAAAYTLWQVRQGLNNGNYEPNNPLPWLTIGAPLVGLVLGLLQILPEQKRDQWAFLVHRPVPRDVIFGGKVAAGLLLYFLATLLPSIITIVWVAMPGHIPAPFDVRLALPGLADILAGAAYYFAGLMIALRPARWYGSRALPLPAAVICSFIVVVAAEFWQAVVAVILCAALLALAAWGSFRTSSDYARQPKAAKASLATILYAGVIVVVWAATGLIVSFLSSNQSVSNISNTFYGITKAGQILRVTNMGYKTVAAVDLNGKPAAHWEVINNQFLATSNMDWLLNYVPQSSGPRYRDTERFFDLIRPDGFSPSPDFSWYYRYTDNRILGYSINTKRLVLVGGPSGIVPTSQAWPAPFVGQMQFRDGFYGAPQNAGLLYFDHDVYALDLVSKRINLLLTVPPPDHVVYITRDIVNREGSGMHYQFTVTTTATVSEYSGGGARLLSVPRYLKTTGAGRYHEYQMTRLPDGSRYFFWYGQSKQESHVKRPTQIILETDSHGKLIKQITLPEVAPAAFSQIWEFGIVMPPVYLAGMGAYILGHPHLASSEELGITTHRMAYVSLVAVAVLTGIVAGILAWLIGRRCGWKRAGQWAWALGIFVLGIYGLLMLLALVAWPARERCLACGRKRVVTHEHCEYCGAPFAPISKDGTEIFDEVTERVTVS